MNSKYLKYAIGEILLVVVGILIALGINNWNEERKQKNLQSQYLSSMLEEFEIFQYDLEFQISQNEMLIEKLSNSIKILDSGSIPNWKLEGEIGALGTSWTTQTKMPIYLEFIQNGLLANLEDQKLKDQFRLLGLNLERQNYAEAMVTKQYTENIEPFIYEHLNYSKIALDNYDGLVIKGGPDVDYSKFSNDLKLWNILNLKLELTNVYNNGLQQTNADLDSLKKEINMFFM